MLRIPLNMHNVPEEEVFWPAVWSAYGTANLEGADYRACAAYGPIYKQGSAGLFRTARGAGFLFPSTSCIIRREYAYFFR